MLLLPSRVGRAVSWIFFHWPGGLFDIDLFLEAKSGFAGSWENERFGCAGIILNIFGFLISVYLVIALIINNFRSGYYFENQGFHRLIAIGITDCPGNQVVANWHINGGGE